MVRKFLLTSAVIFFPKGSCIQIAVAVVVSIFFLVLHAHYTPYASALNNWLQTLALVGLLLVYLLGLLIKAQPDMENRGSFDVVLQLVTVAVAAIVVAVPVLIKANKKWQERSAVRLSEAVELAIFVPDQRADDGYHLMDDERRYDHSNAPGLSTGPKSNNDGGGGGANQSQFELELALENCKRALENCKRKEKVQHIRCELQESTGSSEMPVDDGGSNSD
jgi:hypothetical protein